VSQCVHKNKEVRKINNKIMSDFIQPNFERGLYLVLKNTLIFLTSFLITLQSHQNSCSRYILYIIGMCAEEGDSLLN
jgi:hypothetical protein